MTMVNINTVCDSTKPNVTSRTSGNVPDSGIHCHISIKPNSDNECDIGTKTDVASETSVLFWETMTNTLRNQLEI